MALSNEDRTVIAESVDAAHLTTAALRYGIDQDVVVTHTMLGKAADVIDGLCEMITGILAETADA